MKQSESIKNLLAALVEVQSELPTMAKSAKAYGYNYADLDSITVAIKPILKAHGVGYLQSVGANENGTQTLTTRIFDKSGEYIEDTTALPVIQGTKNNSAQTLGMAITYMRRYSLCAMLGITSDEDVDANTQPCPTQSAPAPQPTQKSAPRKPAVKLAGGDSTPEQKARITALLEGKRADGVPFYTTDEKRNYCNMRRTMTAADLIALLENENAKRMTPAPVQQVAEVFDGTVEQESQQDIF